ncbi:DUF433 domain-containing protein [Flavobacterium gelidilacus]|jgi:uncharacterized protein (DUF433 family)|uniref:DUF433 domain-containing protein n=1 Tax=Flavobacterium gelidilacus TaxID=206041 RepID=UPI000411B6B8|nr:DUF433 domain-containing protein [Flavobacterium gelidilacus]
MINYQKYIEIDSELRFGKPIIIGTRISVYDILNWLADGMTFEEIIIDFPELNEEQIKASLAYAADKVHKTRVAS